MEKYVVAVSGGVDSVVLLDKLSNRPGLKLIVAHFDHGIRADSALDARFVASLAKKYGLPFVTKREELGETTSEDLARTRRYAFLRSVALEYEAKLVTAHHADDVIETIAINFRRGTGWRGLAGLDAADIIRPLTNMTKAEIVNYATTHHLDWHEDSTNSNQKYLRNQLRPLVAVLDNETKQKLLEMWARQKMLKRQIDAEVSQLIGSGPSYGRYLFINVNFEIGMELLRLATKARLTRPQLLRALYMIKTARPGRTYQAGGGVEINFTTRNFEVKLVKY
jgi:tRNA(Ile)-lysidine synthetase-like protein